MDWIYYLSACFLLVFNLIALASSLLMIPGNWIVVCCTALFAYVFPASEGHGVSWSVVGIAFVLAVLGEIIEFAASAAGAAKEGASRRSAALSLVGALIGSLIGAVIAVPVPILGPIIGALAGGCIGAFGGAYVGERWKGRTLEDGMTVGRAAMWGRLFGTIGKFTLGAIMVALITIDSIF